MIDVYDLMRRIVDRQEVEGIASAVRATTEGLADCWDECSDENARRRSENPYRAALKNELGIHAPTLPTRTQRMFVVTVDDAELAAMQIIVATLDELDDRTQNRVIKYISERVAYETQAQH